MQWREGPAKCVPVRESKSDAIHNVSREVIDIITNKCNDFKRHLSKRVGASVLVTSLKNNLEVREG